MRFGGRGSIGSLLVAAALAACAGDLDGRDRGGEIGPTPGQDDEGEDAIDGSALASDRNGTCAWPEDGSPEACGILRLANQATQDVLDYDVGLSFGAAISIVARRVGADGLPGTSDDQRFATLAQLDAVPYVGPFSFRKLLSYAESHGFVACCRGDLEGEACGCPSHHPSVCDDDDPCTEDQIVGTSDDCSALCEHTAVAVCSNHDGCCPSGCGGGSDSDCQHAVCGDGRIDQGELCDIGLAQGTDGSCPVSCDDGNPCTYDSLIGSGCQRHCASRPITEPTTGDGCCVQGGTGTGDGDCPILTPVSSPQTVCPGRYHWPSVVAGNDRFLVGCHPYGNQNVTPELKFLDGLGFPIASQSLLTSDGYYYKTTEFSFADNRFQAVYEYNCDDDGSWRVGWGWGCVDFREYETNGRPSTPSVVFGETGHNGHPVIAHNGRDFGVAWISYDNFFFRRINADRTISGGPGNNVAIGIDPRQSDNRSGARTKIVWNPDTQSFGVFFIIDMQMYFTLVRPDGAVLVSLTSIGPAYSQYFGGQFKVVYTDGAFRVLYLDPSNYNVLLTTVYASTELGPTTTILVRGTGTSAYVHPDMVERRGRLYIATNLHGTTTARLSIHAPDGTLFRQGTLGDSMAFPALAYDPTTDRIGIAYSDRHQEGNVGFQVFAP